MISMQILLTKSHLMYLLLSASMKRWVMQHVLLFIMFRSNNQIHLFSAALSGFPANQPVSDSIGQNLSHRMHKMEHVSICVIPYRLDLSVFKRTKYR